MTNDIVLPVHPHCFVCDPNNPAGMGIQWYGRRDRQSIYGSVTISDTFVGPPKHAHGGAAAAILDDAMGTCAWFAGHQVMTAKMVVDYRRPTPLNQQLSISAWVEKVDGRKIYIRAQILRPDGKVTAESDGLFIEIPEAFVDDAQGRFEHMKAYAAQVKAAQLQASS